MGAGASETFYVKGWVVRATYVMGAIQLAASLLMLVFGRVLDTGMAMPLVFAFGGSLTVYQAWWTSRTPFAVVDSIGVTVRPALLASPAHIEFGAVRAFARLPPGWLVFLARDGRETRIPLTPLSEQDADLLVHALLEHLTEVSYVET